MPLSGPSQLRIKGTGSQCHVGWGRGEEDKEIFWSVGPPMSRTLEIPRPAAFWERALLGRSSSGPFHRVPLTSPSCLQRPPTLCGRLSSELSSFPPLTPRSSGFAALRSARLRKQSQFSKPPLETHTLERSFLAPVGHRGPDTG